MNAVYDPPPEPKDRPKSLARPRDAATLILLRRDDDTPRVLMGRRSSGHDFMPDKYVFPGGRVDAQDGRTPALSELAACEEEALRTQARRRPRAFALTAVRETFEETGLMIGREAEGPASPPKGWDQFFDQNVAPCLKNLSFVGRAVTPPYRPKRFDARFFLADAADALVDDRPPVDGAELVDLKWFTLEDAVQLDLPSVTRFMLGEIGERVAKPDTGLRPFFLRWSRSGHRMERL
ncbi:MAG: NUDIX hydrolase [Pseudomonadota bacterium]